MPNLIQKAADRIASLAASSGLRGVLSTFIPGLDHHWGQPNTVNAQAGGIYGPITPERMREIVPQCSTTAGAMRSHRCSSKRCGCSPCTRRHALARSLHAFTLQLASNSDE